MERTLNIVYALPEFITETSAGGLATYYDNVARLLADRGCDVTVFVRSDKNETFSYYPGVTVKRLVMDQNAVDSKVPSSFMRFWSREINDAVKRYREGGRVDLVQYANFLGYGFERLEDVPTVVRFSSFQPSFRAASRLLFDPKKERWCETAADYLEMLSVVKADSVYSPSKLLADVFESETGKKVRVIESPYYPQNVNTNAKCYDYICAKDFILTFCTMNILKGMKLIGDNIYEVLDKNPGITWVFAGVEDPWIDEDGNKVIPSEYIKKGAGNHADRVVCLGKVDHGELMKIVEKARICVMPSRMDNLPNTCIEAMALGKLVVGTRGASFEQLITDGESGFLMERENGKELVQTISKALQLDDGALDRMGKMAKARIDKMKPDFIAGELLDLYQNTIENFGVVPKYHVDSCYEELKKKYNLAICESGADGDKYLL